MPTCRVRRASIHLAVLWAALPFVGPGCCTLGSRDGQLAIQSPVPRELSKTVLPMYVIEPPDILLIEAIHVVPRPPYHLRTLDTLAIEVAGTPSEAPISGL